MLHWEFADFKSWHVYGAAYELGLLLPLLFLGDTSKFLSTGSVLSVELVSVTSSGWGLCAASWLAAPAERAAFCMKLRFSVRQKLDSGIHLRLGREDPPGGGLGAFAARACMHRFPQNKGRSRDALENASTNRWRAFGGGLGLVLQGSPQRSKAALCSSSCCTVGLFPCFTYLYM